MSLDITWVGVAGFEPTASSSRTKHATKLRHTPVDRESIAEPGARPRGFGAPVDVKDRAGPPG